MALSWQNYGECSGGLRGPFRASRCKGMTSTDRWLLGTHNYNRSGKSREGATEISRHAGA